MIVLFWFIAPALGINLRFSIIESRFAVISMNKAFPHFTRTRIAPTPSGFLHLGNAFSFALTAGLAQQSDAKILLRIDDMDRERVNHEYLQDIFDTLDFLEIPFHEGPRSVAEFEAEWSQRHRLGLYRSALERLWDTGKAFACTCSRADIRRMSNDDVYPGTCRQKGLAPDAPGSSWRLQTDIARELEINTWPGGKICTTLPPDMTDFVIRKKDDNPAYQLSSVVDDLHFGVDFIVRGQDLFASTLAQHYLAQQLGGVDFGQIVFYHHSLLTESNGNKLSKSAGATSIKHLREQGKTATDVYSAIANMLGFAAPANSWQELTALIFN